MGKNNVAAILSYFLSILYLILRYFFGHYSGNKEMADYIFIFIHLGFIALALVTLLWIYIAIAVSFLSGKLKDQDKKDIKLILKTGPARFGLAILYWLLPIGLYCYYIFHINYLYVFVWLPLWYPVLYYFIEKYIKNKEVKIGSPAVKYW